MYFISIRDIHDRISYLVSRISYLVSRISYFVSQIADTKKPRYLARLWSFYAPLKQGALT
ncbi:hypothetical protein VCRA2113O212_80052 [Vibrio crassostreae]|nr:hypothetical protein VCRA2114E123_100027 [Vibrio crassostreae]CAK1694221.1 hypothetical protein VCRA2113O221_100027 [Vibrio crassostreae]CAK1707207.1 hypothetical protein VCRA2113O196_100145 [Vibrio crassostreae]CAK1707501.1 hypothetical protein VCRA2114E122_100144 [Vibrio crassostreae]CAK1709258.1 hypothetical protein VCRA2110O113_100163 [Vibrio crassostreae]